MASAADVPFAWVAADSIYGVSEIEMMLRHQAKGYVLSVSGAHPFSSRIGKPEVGGTAEEIAEELDESAWQRLSAGAGTKGERLYDWAYCELADLEADEYNASLPGVWIRGLLIRRSLTDGAPQKLPGSVLKEERGIDDPENRPHPRRPGVGEPIMGHGELLA